MKIREIKGIYYNLYGSSKSYKPSAKGTGNFAEILNEKLSAEPTDAPVSPVGNSGPMSGVRIIVSPRITQPIAAELHP